MPEPGPTPHQRLALARDEADLAVGLYGLKEGMKAVDAAERAFLQLRAFLVAHDRWRNI